MAGNYTSIIECVPSMSVEGIKDCSYMAPEIRPGTGGSATMESDVYGMAIVAYKVLSY